MTRKSNGRLRRAWAVQLPDHVVGVGHSPDGRWVAAAAVSGPVWVMAAADGRVTAELSGHGFGTAALAWSPAGDRLATAGQDGKVRIWDAAMWQERAALPGGSAWVEHLAFRPDGSALASAAGKVVRLWDAAGNQIREWTLPGAVSALAWRPSGSALAVAVYGGVRLFDPDQPEPVLSLPWKGAPLSVAWSPDGQMLAHGNQDASVHFWSVKRPQTPLQMSGYPAKVRALAWDYSSRYLATGGGPSACVWDCGGKGPEGSKPQLLGEHGGPLSALAYQQRGFLLVSGGPNGLHLWQPANRKGPLIGQDALKQVSAVSWAPDDKGLAAGTADGTVAGYRVT